MKRISIVFLFVLVSITLKAQYNLVPNPSFEIYDTCPNNYDQTRYAVPWTNPSHSSSDYYNACSNNPEVDVPSNWPGFEPARTGSGYGFIITAEYNFPPYLIWNNYREYLEVQLTDSLIGNVDYCIRFYVSAGDSMRYVSNNIGIYFSPTLVQDSTPFNLPYVPQFENPSSNNLNSRNGWTLVAGTYHATGGEKYIVIGNFRDTNTTISTYTGWGNFANFYAGYYIDDVLITPCDSLTGIEETLSIQLVKVNPNPFRDYFTVESQEQILKEINVYDITGRMIYNDNLISKRKMEINLSSQPQGLYYLKIITDKSNFVFKLIKT